MPRAVPQEHGGSRREVGDPRGGLAELADEITSRPSQQCASHRTLHGEAKDGHPAVQEAEVRAQPHPRWNSPHPGLGRPCEDIQGGVTPAAEHLDG